MSDSFMLSLNEDTEELLGFNPEADANQLLPPIPAGEYLVKFRFTNPNEDFKDEKTGETKNKRWQLSLWGQKNPQKVLVTSLIGEVYGSEGGMYDGRQIRDGLVSTMLQQQTGTCRMQGVIQCITGGFPPTCKTRPQFMALLSETIGEDGGATGLVSIDWEASENLTEEQRETLRAEGKKPFRMRGMKNFPQAKDADGKIIPGVHVPEVSYNGETYRAYNTISRYITASEQTQQPVEEAPVVPPQAARVPQQRAPQAAPQQSAANAVPPVPPRVQAPQVPKAPAARVPQGPRTPPRAA